MLEDSDGKLKTGRNVHKRFELAFFCVGPSLALRLIFRFCVVVMLEDSDGKTQVLQNNH